MSEGFSDPIAAGDALIIPALQSPNYAAGTSGWAVFRNGTAEFNNLTIRGTFFGTDFIINSSGAFFYSGTPALGNLIASIASAAGTDGFGNAYAAGHSAYLGVQYLSLQGFELLSSIGTVLQAVTPGPDGVNPAWSLGIFTSTLGLVSELVGDGIKVIVDNPLVALAPGSSVGSHTAETWHSLGALSGATNTTVNQGRYRLTPDGECEIDIACTATGNTGAGAFAFANTLPAAYQFAGNYTRAYAAGFNGTITTATNNCDVLVDGAGTANPGRVRLQAPVLPVNTSFGAVIRIPLS